MKRKKIVLRYSGDGKTKKTAIYFLDARHRQQEEEFEAYWLGANKVKFPKTVDKKNECYGYDGPEGNYEWFSEGASDYLRYNTTKGELWFRYDRPTLQGDKYLDWLDEQGL